MIHKLSLLLLTYAAIILLLCTTDPFKLPSFFLLVPFFLLFAALFQTFYLALRVGLRLSGLTLKKRSIIRICFAAAGLPTMMIVMQSIGQVAVRDAVTLGVLFVLLDFLIARTRLSGRAVARDQKV